MKRWIPLLLVNGDYAGAAENFAGMSGGYLGGVLFFLFMTFASFSAVIDVLVHIIANEWLYK